MMLAQRFLSWSCAPFCGVLAIADPHMQQVLAVDAAGEIVEASQQAAPDHVTHWRRPMYARPFLDPAAQSSPTPNSTSTFVQTQKETEHPSSRALPDFAPTNSFAPAVRILGDVVSRVTGSVVDLLSNPFSSKEPEVQSKAKAPGGGEAQYVGPTMPVLYTSQPERREVEVLAASIFLSSGTYKSGRPSQASGTEDTRMGAFVMPAHALASHAYVASDPTGFVATTCPPESGTACRDSFAFSIEKGFGSLWNIFEADARERKLVDKWVGVTPMSLGFMIEKLETEANGPSLDGLVQVQGATVARPRQEHKLMDSFGLIFPIDFDHLPKRSPPQSPKPNFWGKWSISVTGFEDSECYSTYCVNTRQHLERIPFYASPNLSPASEGDRVLARRCVRFVEHAHPHWTHPCGIRMIVKGDVILKGGDNKAARVVFKPTQWGMDMAPYKKLVEVARSTGAAVPAPAPDLES
ncbi:unnamed protein product [Amoebophrya sp. A25]|nr:unnamed protein product [Amoebophrya sp. A25]|eukprot:GSA25T00023073001.1